ncbi:hypothetical protein [Paenibacillus koleovorans]|nr:hypothetical protein [Paenibacillus koleovorans]
MNARISSGDSILIRSATRMAPIYTGVAVPFKMLSAANLASS